MGVFLIRKSCKIPAAVYQSCPDFGLVGVAGEEDGNELGVEVPPLIREVGSQVLSDIEIGSDEPTLEALRSMDATASQHDSVDPAHSLPPYVEESS